MSRADVTRRIALFVLIDQGFGGLVLFAYQQLLVGHMVPASFAISVALAVHLSLSLARTGFLLYLLRPLWRWLSLTPAERAAPEPLESAAAAALKLPYRSSGWNALSWGMTYIIVTLVLALLSPAMTELPPALWPATICFSIGLGLGAYALHLALWGFLMAPFAGEASLVIRRTGVVTRAARDSTRAARDSLMRRSLALALCLALAPVAWISSVVFESGDAGSTNYLVVLAAFALVVLVWAPLCAALMVGTVATPVIRVTKRLDELRRAPDVPDKYVPVSFQDELGVLATATNDLIDELGSRAARIASHEQERERLLLRVERERSLLQHLIENLPVAVALLKGPEASIALKNKAFDTVAPEGMKALRDWTSLASVALPVLEEVTTSGASRTVRGCRLGSDLHVDIICVPFASELTRQLLLLVDVTEQTRAHEQVREMGTTASRRASELRSVMDHLVEAVLVCDAQGQVTLANEAFLRMMSASSMSQIRWPIERFTPMFQHPDGRPIEQHDLPLAKALEGTVVRHQEVMLRSTPAELPRYFRVSAAPIRDGGSAELISGAVAVCHDITDERELEDLKSAFVGTAAHELKTPVAVMKAHAQLLLKGPADDRERIHLSLEAIDRGANRIDRIVQKLLEVMQIRLGRSALALERVSLRSMVEAVAARASARWSGHRVQLDIPPDTNVIADPTQMTQVLDVLLDNALKHSPEAGEILVRAGADHNTVRMSVSDRGAGIPGDKQPLIFRPFFRAHRGFDERGLGLGLYIAREIVLHHGGTLSFSSAAGKGTTFTLELPAGGAS